MIQHSIRTQQIQYAYILTRSFLLLAITGEVSTVRMMKMSQHIINDKWHGEYHMLTCWDAPLACWDAPLTCWSWDAPLTCWSWDAPHRPARLSPTATLAFSASTRLFSPAIPPPFFVILLCTSSHTLHFELMDYHSEQVLLLELSSSCKLIFELSNLILVL